MSQSIHFACTISCSSQCCGGATILTLPELKHLYTFFPISIGFRKISPVNDYHREYLKEITFQHGNSFINGDFIGGNRFKRKCRFLKNSLCLLHEKPKPLQCRVVPFSVTFPEDYQHMVIKERRKGAFRNCEGFKDNHPIAWDGAFKEQKLKEEFDELRKNLSLQRDFMENLFLTLHKSEKRADPRIRDGMFLEMPIPHEFIYELCERADIDRNNFLRVQKELFIKELGQGSEKDFVFIEGLRILEIALKN